MAGRRVHFVFPEELVLRVDACLGPGQSRGEWVRGAVEQALGTGGGAMVVSQENEAISPPAPAEQPEESEGLRDLEARVDDGARSMGPGPIRDLVERSGRPAREFRPYPKGGG